jgi:ATP-binding cassette subfamily B protein
MVEGLTVAIALVFVWLASSTDIVATDLSITNITLFSAAILFVRSEALKIVYGYAQLATTESATREVMELMTWRPATPPASADFCGKIESVTFDNLSFGYAGSPPIIENCSATITPGGVTCITGRSGEGKTTLLNLCMRVYDPDRGTIRYNSTDIARIGNLYDKIALIEQEPYIFEGSLLDNISLGRRIDPGRVLTMVDRLQLSYLAASEQELTSCMIGGRHRKLSTGEKQRIAIIRALTRGVDLLFLDEITSNIDTHNAAIVTDFVADISRDVIVVAVSHDPIFISRASALYRLENGTLHKIDEHGHG